MPRPLPPEVVALTGGDPVAVRAHILDATRRVIESVGLAAASTRAIADAAGLSGGTLYNYFDNRIELVAAAIVDRARLLTDVIADFPARAGGDTITGNLDFFVGRTVAVLDQLVPLFAAAFSDEQLMAAIRRQIQELSHTVPLADPPGVVERYLLAERDLGRVRMDVDCRAAALLVVGICHDDAFHHHLAGGLSQRLSHTTEMAFIADAVTAHISPS